MTARVLPEDTSRRLLEDSLVQQAIQEYCEKSGKDAADSLKDAGVQKAITTACRERFSDWADALDQNLARWVLDHQVRNLARLATEWSLSLMQKESDTIVVARVQQGSPAVVFAAQCTNLIVFVHCTISICVPTTLLWDPVAFVVIAHQLMFALASALFEVRAHWVQSVVVLDECQNYLMEKAKFMAENVGRGLFYLFQASVWLALMGSNDSMWFICFVCTFGVGVALISSPFTKTVTYSDKVSQMTTYRKVPQTTP